MTCHISRNAFALCTFYDDHMLYGFVLYSYIMDSDQDLWWVWARFLQRWGVREMAASILEAVGPYSILGAQFIYIGQPVLKGILPEAHLITLARSLEDRTRRQALVDFLWEAPSP